MDMVKFIDMVRRLRDAQRAYFRYGRPGDLEKAKGLERLVDGMMAEHYEGPGLFGPPPSEATAGGQI